MTLRWTDMTPVKPFIRPLVVLLAVWFYAPPTTFEPPSDWRELDFGGCVLSVPPDLHPSDVVAIDSIAGEYVNSSMSLGLDLGIWSSRLDEWDRTDFKQHVERIGGQRARIVSFHAPQRRPPFHTDFVGVHFASIAHTPVRLTLSVRYTSEADYDTSISIFRTIRFRPAVIRQLARGMS